MSDRIYKSAIGGGNTGYMTNEEKAVSISNMWDTYSKGKISQKSVKDLADSVILHYNTETTPSQISSQIQTDSTL